VDDARTVDEGLVCVEAGLLGRDGGLEALVELPLEILVWV
jgi:hypothetical protein